MKKAIVLLILSLSAADSIAAQYAITNGTNSAGTWTTSGATTLHEAIDETSQNGETNLDQVE